METKLNTAKALAIRLLSIFKDKSGPGDSSEYTSVLKFAFDIANDVHRWRDRPEMQISTDIDLQMSSFADLINNLTSNNRLPRYLLSSRLRRVLDRPSAAIFNSAHSLYQLLGDRRSGHSFPELERATEELLSECPDSRAFWERNFGQSIMVPLNRFIQALGHYFEIHQYTVVQLQYLLDNSNTGYISMRRFATMIRGFGPFTSVISNVASLFQYNWFHGYLSTQEADNLLKNQAQGTFLVRFSKASCDAVVISCHLFTSQPMVHTVVQKATANSGFVVEDASRGRQEFPTLLGVVQRYNLTTALQSQVSRLGWFFGDISGQEAGELLADKPNGCYLIRFSSQPNHYAITHISDKNVKHGLIECLPHGYKLEHSPIVNASLTETLSQSKLLKVQIDGIPLVPTPPDAFEASGELSKFPAKISRHFFDLCRSTL